MNLNLSRDIFRHRGELARALRRREFEIAKNGNILIPSMNLEAKTLGVFDISINGSPPEYSDNLLPTEARNWMLEVMYGGATALSAWRMALFSGNVTPGATLTGETFASVCTEFTDYDETTRPEFVDAAAASGSKNNHSNRAVFTVSASVVSPVTLYGAALLQASAKGDATAGQKIGAASRFTAEKPVSAGDIASVGYSITLTST